MKTMYKKTVQIIVAILIASVSMSLQAQDTSAGYITISGVVKDKKTNKKLEYVTIGVPGTNIGTISNTDGEFSIKIKSDLNAKALDFSYIGYYNATYPITGDAQDITIQLSPNINVLSDVVVEAVDARKLVEKAIAKIPANYGTEPTMLSAFYRETVKKRRSYINISEAILEIYKTPYSDGISGDRVQVYKGRKLLSPKVSDTLVVKLQGGPNLSLFLDIVKNPEFILDANSLSDYKFEVEESVMVDDRPNYVVSFTPQVVYPYPLHYGKLYIDKQSLAFSRAEFKLSMDDRNKATQTILKKKPFNLRFKPEEVSFLVTYKLQDGKSYLNYVWNEVKFKCDWKRRLFSTGYTIVSEMVVTDRTDENVAKITNKQAFKSDHVLSDKVGNFYDTGFWENYNIIEPTESLENAVDKLKKQYK